MKRKLLAGYIVYGILVTGLFFWWLFPAEILIDSVRSAVSARVPGLALTVEKAGLSFPPGVKLRGCTFQSKAKPSLSVILDVIEVRPVLGSVLFGDKAVLVRAKAYGGTIKARVTTPESDGGNGTVRVAAAADGIEAGKCTWIEVLAGRKFQGSVTGALAYEGTAAKPLAGSGDLSLSIEDGVIPLAGDLFGFSEIPFDTLESKATMKNRVVKIDTLNIKGPAVGGELTGRVSLREPLDRSTLALQGDVNVHALNRTMKISLTGTVEKPIPRVR